MLTAMTKVMKIHLYVQSKNKSYLDALNAAIERILNVRIQLAQMFLNCYSIHQEQPSQVHNKSINVTKRLFQRCYLPPNVVVSPLFSQRCCLKRTMDCFCLRSYI